MRFRVRDYRAEAMACELPRFPAHHHPLRIPPSPSRDQIGASLASHPMAPSLLPQSDRIGIDKTTTPLDPLRYPLGDTFVSNYENAAQYAAEKSLDDYNRAVKVLKKEWVTFRRSLMQKSSISRIPVRSMPDVIRKSSKGKSLTSMHLEQIDDPQKASEEEFEYITHQQYVSQLNELKNDISKAWAADDRVTALKLSIKVARLLMDTPVLSFYPTLFILVTDILDTLGDLVWERIKRKAEYDDDGKFVTSLPERFGATHIRSEARDTCHNWFAKIGGIRELLPRIYLELAILHCHLFLGSNLISTLGRLTMMIRGIVDPLASAYCRIYMVRCAQVLFPSDSGYLITSIDDFCTLTRLTVLGNENFYGSFEKRKLVFSLLEPAVEWMMKCLFRCASQSEQKLHVICEKLGLQKNTSKMSKDYPCISVVLYYFLKELPSEILPHLALDIADLIENCKDTSLDQWLNYRLLGSKLCESGHSFKCIDLILEKVIKVALHYDEFYEYLKVADAYLDFTLQNYMEGHLNTILEEISMRTGKNKVTEKELACIESIMLKLVNHFTKLEDLLTLKHFMHILHATYGGTCRSICMCILGHATRSGCIQEPMVIQLLFEISQILYDELEFLSFDNDRYDSLIARFIQQVNFGCDVEEHLNFLVDCRAAFGRTDQILDTIIHSSNYLAVKAMKVAGNSSVDFLKACLVFTEVTILSIMDNVRRINLSLETAEIALQCGLVSHTDDLINVSISSFESLDPKSGSNSSFDAERVASSIQCLCSFLIMVPAFPGHGICCFLRRLLDVTNSMLWMPSRLISRVLFAIVAVSAAVSQRRLAYHVYSDGVMGDDLLYVGEPSLLNELLEICDSVVHSIVNILERESNAVARGYSALEACHCLLSAFQVTDASHICYKLIHMAKSSLPENDTYLQSAVSRLDKFFATYEMTVC